MVNSRARTWTLVYLWPKPLLPACTVLSAFCHSGLNLNPISSMKWRAALGFTGSKATPKNVFKYIKVWKPNRESVRTLHYPLQKVPLGQTERVKLTEYLTGVFSH